MATALRSAAPPYALRVWADNNAVYTEIPGKGKSLPHVLSFPLCDSGLAKALNFLRRRHTDFAGPIYSRPEVSPSNRPLVGTQVQRAHAQAVLKRMGII